MQRLKDKGHTIFLNSHLLGEVELICDRVAILQRGSLVREGDVKSLTEQHGQFQLRLAPGEAFPADELKRRGYSARPTGDLWEVDLTESQSIDPVIVLLSERGLHLRHLVEKRQTLEEAFLATVEGAEPGIDGTPAAKPATVRPGRAVR
jgi:ABC-type multidrug transport system, ATPase component